MSRKHRLISAALVSMVSFAAAQTSQSNKVLTVPGHSGEAAVIQSGGRNYVDVDALARIVNGSVASQGSQMVLTLPPSTSGTSSADNRFSRGFVDAAIESLASMREWATSVSMLVKNGYPVGNSIDEYRNRAAKNFALASAAASNESDRNGLQLLTNEYNNLKAWSEGLVAARNSMSAANYSMSQDALMNDPASQKLLHCWKFLGPMFAKGTFEDDGSCR